MAVLAAASLLTGCPPKQYCSFRNMTNKTILIDGCAEGSGSLLPHFDLLPGANQRVVAAPTFTARDPQGQVIGSVNLTIFSQRSDSYDPHTYTFYIAITHSGFVADLAHMRE
jgi:hypothetical protein